MSQAFPPLLRIRRAARRVLTASLVAAALSQVQVEINAAHANDDVSGPRRAAPSSSELARYDGKWNRIADADQDSARMDSIDTAVDDLPWIMRGMARGFLKKSTAPPPEMNFTWDGERLHQLVPGEDGESRRLVQLNGPLVTLKDHRGEDFSSTWTWSEVGLQVNWAQDQAYGSNIYRVDERKKTLLVEHRINITAIDNVDPIVFSSRFGRIELPAVAAATEP